MSGQGRSARRLAAWALGAVLAAAGAGCSLPLYSVHPVPPDLAQTCADIALCSRDHVYIFFMQGLDPLDHANLEGVKKYVQELGFHQAWFGFAYHAPHFKKEILRLRDKDPQARFVLVGFSYGCNVVRDMTHSLGKKDVHIDLLIYVDGKFLGNDPANQPDNADRLINIVASKQIANKCDMPGVENVSVPEKWHYGTPTYPATLLILVRELAALAGQVLAVDELFGIPRPPLEPTPRPVAVQPPRERDEWDFLKPSSLDSRAALPPLPTPRVKEAIDDPEEKPPTPEKAVRR
jgi:hypothetical protein